MLCVPYVPEVVRARAQWFLLARPGLSFECQDVLNEVSKIVDNRKRVFRRADATPVLVHVEALRLKRWMTMEELAQEVMAPRLHTASLAEARSPCLISALFSCPAAGRHSRISKKIPWSFQAGPTAVQLAMWRQEASRRPLCDEASLRIPENQDPSAHAWPLLFVWNLAAAHSTATELMAVSSIQARTGSGNYLPLLFCADSQRISAQRACVVFERAFARLRVSPARFTQCGLCCVSWWSSMVVVLMP